MWETIKKPLIGLIASKKVQTAILGALSVLAVKYLTVDQELADQISKGLLILVVVLIGAQGLTDLGKGDTGKPQTLKEAFASVVKGLLGSKKFITAVAGGLAFVMVKYLNLGGESASEISTWIMTIASTLVGAQGLADVGKAAQPTAPTPPAAGGQQ